jgi:hypothetical protein
MKENVLEHYRQFSLYTNPGPYREALAALPGDVGEIGRLVRGNAIHRMVWAMGNTGGNADLKYGDMGRVPWWRQPEDDNLPTAAAMLAELYRRDPRGLVADRALENRIIITCRFVAVLMASILKSRGTATRVRSGNAAYFEMGELGKVSADHWIGQYWHERDGRWVTFDADGCLEIHGFDPFDMPEDVFDFPAQAWLDIRAGREDPTRFYNAKPERGAIVVLWSLFYDFHSLMNSEIIYLHNPAWGDPARFGALTAKQLEKIDGLARMMLDPDGNFTALKDIWETERDFRLLSGALLP